MSDKIPDAWIAELFKRGGGSLGDVIQKVEIEDNPLYNKMCTKLEDIKIQDIYALEALIRLVEKKYGNQNIRSKFDKCEYSKISEIVDETIESLDKKRTTCKNYKEKQPPKNTWRNYIPFVKKEKEAAFGCDGCGKVYSSDECYLKKISEEIGLLTSISYLSKNIGGER